MGFLSALKPKKKSKGKEDTAAASTVVSDISSSTHSDDKLKKKKSRSKRHSSKPEGSSRCLTVASEELSVPETTANERVIEDYLKALNRHCSVEEMLSFFASPDVMVEPEDAPAVPASVFANILRDCYLSFTDMSFDGHSIKEIRPGTVEE